MSTQAGLLKTTNDQVNTTVTLANIDGLVDVVEANKTYRFEFMVPFSTAALTTGISLAVACPASPTYITYQVVIPFAADGAAGVWWGVGTSSGDKVTSTGVPAINTVYMARVIGIMKNGANNGSLALQFASEVAASGVTVKTGAWGNVDGGGL